ncbi:MAG: hypothetical protein AAF514_17775 [Verrucomicrobiota bacterium]
MRVLVFLILAIGPVELVAQVTPAHPSEFGRRGVGSGLNPAMAGVRSSGSGQKKTITIHYLAVSKERDWTNRKGTVIKATLLAFEAGNEMKPGQALTLISDGKVRLLVRGRKKPSLVALSDLSAADQKFIKTVDRANRESANADRRARQDPGQGGPSLPPPLNK